MTATAPDLRETVAILALVHPAPDILTDPLHQVLWDNMGYLIDDERRAAIFQAFAARVGLSAAQIAAADEAILFDLAGRGGMRPEARVQRWREIARIVTERAGGDLGATLRAMPPAKARAMLEAFPTIGAPGADRILLFAGVAARPCLESNGLRVLARLGFFVEARSYQACYRAAIDILARDGLADRDWLVTAYLALRDHGRSLCKRGAPLCHACPLDSRCAHAAVANL